jgi:hypothetical protein
MRAARAPRPRLPLWTQEVISAADYRAEIEADMLERAVQRELLADLANPLLTDGPVLAVHIPNGVPMCGVPADIRARIWRQMRLDGARAGAADLLIGHAGRWLALEVKRETGRLSVPQREFAADCKLVRAPYRDGYGLSDCRRILTELGVFRAGAFLP